MKMEDVETVRFLTTTPSGRGLKSYIHTKPVAAAVDLQMNEKQAPGGSLTESGVMLTVYIVFNMRGGSVGTMGLPVNGRRTCDDSTLCHFLV